MKISEVQAACMGSMRTRSMAAVGVALAVGGTFMAPAFGEDNGHREDQQHGYSHDQGHQRDHGDRRSYHRDSRHGDYYGNQDYVYAPPPVVYAPESEPGINLFIPLYVR